MISIVVPVLNEEESLPFLYKALTKELYKIKSPSEIIFIDDGSTDNSLTELKKLAKNGDNVRIFSFRKNQGKAEALMLGFQEAHGEQIITLDADLQDVPSEIHKLIKKQKEDGTEVVSGWRKDRKDKKKMKAISQVFNNIAGALFDLHLHDYNCGLKIYTREAAKGLRLYGGLHRFIPLLAFEQGFSVDEVAVEHAPRTHGKSKYGFSKLWKDLPDIFTMLFLVRYSKRPLHFFGIIGSAMLIVGILTFAYLTFIHFAFGAAIGRRPLLLFSMLLIISGFQVFFTGFIAELIINISHREYHHPPLRYNSDHL